MVVNTYGISVGIEKIGWKLYLVYIGWICVELVIIYFVSFLFFSFSFLPRLSLSLLFTIPLPLLRTTRTTNWVPRNDTHANTFLSCSSLSKRQEKRWKNSSRFSRRRILARHLLARLKWPWLREVKWCMLIRYR